MLDRSKGTGRVVWRCAGGGTEQVMLNRFTGMDGADANITRMVTSYMVSRSALRKPCWAKNEMTVCAADLFETRPEALAEFRRRRDG